MIKIYQDNGLPFYDETWLRDRAYARMVLRDTMQRLLNQANPAWQMYEIEAPALMPQGVGLSAEYATKDVFMDTDAEIVLRPETTASSYAYAQHLLEHQQAKPPLCVYQAGRSYRRENDQVSKNVRLKEFYQMEFQCIVTDDTKMDYQDEHFMLYPLCQSVHRLTGIPPRIVDSDRLPSYSDRTIDIEIYIEEHDKWLEVASISKRHDVPFEWDTGTTKLVGDGSAPQPLAKNLINYEFAFGLDRLVHAMRAS